ncbi:MAG: twin-arginine translocation pathway signal [Cyanobacteriota bacterium]|nr:twin-arginine translocation pathway signal [Cyanobacteriota bacterium]
MAGHVPTPPAPDATLNRRQVLRLGLCTGTALALPGVLSGCRPKDGPRLLAARASLPAAWLEALPDPWRSQLVDTTAIVAQALQDPTQGSGGEPAMLSLPDGWASPLPADRLQPFGAERVLKRLSAAAAPVSRLFRPEGQPPQAFPWAFSPWVLVLRSQPALAVRARGREGWAVLIDPALQDRLVLPSSPRVVMEIFGRDPTRLRALRSQALASDDRNGLNLLLSGEATAAVMPLQRLIPLLQRDQRLEVVLPASGAPLSWQLLLRPAAAGADPPLEWLGALLEPPLLNKVLAGGWVPPLPRRELAPVLSRMPRVLADLLLPSDAVLERCRSLPPLSPQRRLAMQTLWDASAPQSR